MAERMVIVGGDAAGMSAASQARRRRGPDELAITAFERGCFTSYSACGIPYWIAGDVASHEQLIARTPEEFRTRYTVDVRLGTEVVELDLDRREVVARSDSGTERTGFDTLVLATGAVPLRPRLPGVDAPGIFGVQTLGDGVAVRAAVESGARRAVVVGGGYIGVEMAEALLRRGLAVTLVEQSSEPMSTLDPDMGRLVREAMVGLGIEVRTRCTATGFETDAEGRVRRVVTDAGELAADVVVLGIGVRPGTALAVEAGLAIGPTGGVRTDRRMRVVGADGVWAAGDCVETYDLVARQPVYVPLGTHANKQGRVVGVNVGGGYATFPGVVRTAVSKVCSLEIARTGLREVDAERAGLQVVTATVESTTRAGYFPGASPIITKVLAERGSGRLLGAQIVGREGAAKRIDALAVALWNGMTVDEMTSLDLAYAPPFAPVWDPVLVAARKAHEAVERDLRRGGRTGD